MIAGKTQSRCRNKVVGIKDVQSCIEEERKTRSIGYSAQWATEAGHVDLRRPNCERS